MSSFSGGGGDCDLSSINKMLDCASASQFRAFFPPRAKLEPMSLDSSPLHALQQSFGRRNDEVTHRLVLCRCLNTSYDRWI